jgi:perosamine synthetase
MNFEEIQNAIRLSWEISRNDYVPLHEPLFLGNDWNYVKECLDSGWVSSVGKYVDLFEKKIQEFTNSKYAIATVNGTAALHITLLLSGIRKDDEVLIPALTFVATANAVAYVNAIPHFIDVTWTSLGVCPIKLESYLKDLVKIKDGIAINKITNRRIKALIGMHTFGHPIEIEKIQEVCSNYQIEFIEDAAESLGTYYKGKHTGTFSKISAISFNGNKVITTGGGGVILTQDINLAKQARHLTTTAKVPHKWEFYHDMIGYNYRMPNINAALGCAQLEVLPDYLERKRKLANRYIFNFKVIKGLRVVEEPIYGKSNFWLNTLILESKNLNLRNSLLEYLNQSGIMARPAWKLLSNLPMFLDSPKMNLDVSTEIEESLINIPSSPNLIIKI